MALTDQTVEFLRSYFTDAELVAQAAAGAITPEDLSQLMAVDAPDGSIAVSALSSMVGSVTDNTESIIFDVITDTESLTGAFADALLDLQLVDAYTIYNAQEDLLESLESSLTTVVREANNDVVDQITTYNAVPIAEVKRVVDLTQQTVEDSESSILGEIGGILSTVKDVVIDETSDIIDKLSDPLEEIQSITQTVVDKTTGIASALAVAVPEMGEIIADAVTDVGSAVTSGFGAAFDGLINSLGLDQLVNFMQLLGGGMDQASEALDGFSNLDVREGSWDVPASKADVANMWLMSAPFLGSRLGLQYPNEVERLKQNAYEHSRPQLLDVGSTLEYIKRNPDAQELVINNLTRAGYDADKIAQLISMIHQPLGVIENTVALRRGFITSETYAEKLRILGLAPDDIELAERLSMQLPPIGDLIRMVVRDTFEPDVVEQGQLSDGFDTFPVETAEQLGLTPYWSEKYWQAHWDLPSLQQGFEMLHRGEIDRDALLALFKAADIAPGYWRPLEAISYRPFTRVDVRRMHAFGVLDESQVLRAYLDIGYDQEKAQALTDFTIAYNDSTKKVEKTRERDLSKSDIIGMYNDGVIDASATRDYLLKLGYSEDEATVLIDREDIQEMRRERKADITNIIDQAKIKALTFEEAQDRLAALDLTRTETNKALADLARVSQTRTRTPSKSDLDEWLSLGLITSGDYAEELRTLGFADRYVDLYVEATTAEQESDLLAQEEKAARRREPRAVSKGNLDSLFQAEIIDSVGYTEGLTTLGYRESDISNLLEQQLLKLEEKSLKELERLERGEEAAQVERLPSRSLLGKLYLKGLIDIAAYEDGLVLLGFSPENVELLSKLITAKGEESAGQS